VWLGSGTAARFFATHWHDGAAGAFRMGGVQGLYCLDCCWVLMALLFFGGVMNLLWIACLALFVLLETGVPYGAGVSWKVERRGLDTSPVEGTA
jgi:predicted metal-binding membrane protein